MKKVSIIPCRYGSKRFQGKPIAPILGRPMIQWVYERAKNVRLFSDVVVATDDKRIFEAVDGFGGQVVMTAPDHRSGSDRVAEAADLLGLKDEDIVVNIQGDQPAFDARCLSEVISPLEDDPDLGMSTLIYKITNPAEYNDNNHVKCVFDKDHFALYFSRSLIPFAPEGMPTFDVFKHLGVYAFRKGFLDTLSCLPKSRLEEIERLEQLRAMEHGYRIKVVETCHDSLEVDRAEDIAKLEAVLRQEKRN